MCIRDRYGEETTWQVVNNNDIVFASGGPYQNNENGTIVTETFCISDGCYDLIMYDQFGDGMCCDFGEGGYQLLTQFNDLAITSGGEFEDSETNEFCVDSNTILESDKSLQVELYPNPASTEVNIILPSPNASITVYDVSGRMVLKERHDSAVVTLDVSSFQNGSYLIVIEAEGSAYRSMFLKN